MARAVEINPGDIFTIVPYGLQTLTIEDLDAMADCGIHPIEYWADGSVSFQNENEEA